jgi:hypothetical protein
MEWCVRLSRIQQVLAQDVVGWDDEHKLILVIRHLIIIGNTCSGLTPWRQAELYLPLEVTEGALAIGPLRQH